ncbi:hypothetical protein [Eubacterium ramulus]|uniref:hypothetical protein n=1 Tax=Eubacterium ramulus TaxID=39490 RepID=UPI0035223DAF
MTKDEIQKLSRRQYAKTETPVVSNNSAHRWTPDVPMVVPEVNPQHMDVIKYQKERLGTKRGFRRSKAELLHTVLRAGADGVEESSSRMRWWQQPIRPFPEQARPSRTGRRW